MKKLITTIAFIASAVVFSNAQPFNYLWAVDFGGRGSVDAFTSIEKTASGDFYITGDFEGTRSFGSYTISSTGYQDIFLAKYDSAGLCLWVVHFGAAFANAYSNCIAIDNQNNVYIGGSFTGGITIGTQTASSMGNKDMFLAKFDQAGNPYWMEAIGTPQSEEILGVATDAIGEIYITGYFAGSLNFDSYNVNSGNTTNPDLFVAKYNSAGTALWASQGGSSSGNFKTDQGSCIKHDGNGNVIVGGYFMGSATFGSTTLVASGTIGGSDALLIKMDASNGSYVWAKKGGGISTDKVNSLSLDTMGGIYITGLFYGTANFDGLTIIETGGMATYGDMYIAKYNSSGNAVYAKKAGGSNQDQGLYISAEPSGFVYVTGYYSGTINFTGATLPGSGQNDAFFAKYNQSGTIIWAQKVGSPANEKGNYVLAFPAGQLVFAGNYTGTVIIGSDTLSAPLGINEVFFVKLDGGTVGIEPAEADLELGVSIFPVPAADVLSVLSESSSINKIEITDLAGKKVFERTYSEIPSETVTIDVKHFSKGIHLLRVFTGIGVSHYKVVISK